MASWRGSTALRRRYRQPIIGIAPGNQPKPKQAARRIDNWPVEACYFAYSGHRAVL